jgi:hypothetical protein
MSAMMTRVKKVGDYFKAGTFLYSALFGAAVGVGLAGGAYLGRAVHVAFFDEEHYRVQSRQRYLEKQYVFFQQLQESQRVHALANMVQEYDPVDTRLPFQKMEDKYRF